MKINKKYEESIYDNVLPTISVSSLIYAGTEAGLSGQPLENIALYISHSLSASGWDFNKDTNAWKEACEYLDAKITASRKTATFWDVYKIGGTLSGDDFNSKVGSLSNSTSYIFTGESYSYNGESYSAGDVVVRDTYGNLTHVAIGQAGYYKPSGIQPEAGASGTYNLTFKYCNKDTPNDGETHSLSLETTQVDPGSIYNIDQQLKPQQSTDPIKLKSVVENSTTIWVRPVWETWYEGNGVTSRIYNAATVKVNDTEHTYTITNISQLTIRLLAK